jgi:xylulokinase
MIQENKLELVNQVVHILLPKDYGSSQLMGDYALNCSDVFGTILFDIRARTWSPEMLETIEINSAWLSLPFNGTYITGVIFGYSGRRD